MATTDASAENTITFEEAMSKSDEDIKNANTMPNEAFFDMHSVDQTWDLDDGDGGFFITIYNDYFEQMDNAINILGDALKQDDWKVVKENGHSLKGSSAQIGVRYASVLWEEIERVAKSHCQSTTAADKPETDKAKSNTTDSVEHVNRILSKLRIVREVARRRIDDLVKARQHELKD